jgi:hypothetical protein
LNIASGHRGLALLETGQVKSLKVIALREGVDDSYVSGMVNRTTLAPDIVAAILDETLPSEVTLFELAAGTTVLWGEQRGRDPAPTVVGEFIRQTHPKLMSCSRHRSAYDIVRG